MAREAENAEAVRCGWREDSQLPGLKDKEVSGELVIVTIDQYEMKSYHPITIHVTPNSRVSHPGCFGMRKFHISLDIFGVLYL